MVLLTALSLPSVSCSPGSRRVQKPHYLLFCFPLVFYLLVPLTDIRTSPCCFSPSDSASSQLLYLPLPTRQMHSKMTGLTQGGYLTKASLFQLAALQGRPTQVLRSCNTEPDAEVSPLLLVLHPVVYNVTSPAAYIIHRDYSLHCDRI